MLNAVFEIQFTGRAQADYNDLDTNMERRVNEAIERLIQNPFFGPNIVKLKGSHSGQYRYRLGSYRIIYEVDSQNQKCIVLSISTRGKAYNL